MDDLEFAFFFFVFTPKMTKVCTQPLKVSNQYELIF